MLISLGLVGPKARPKGVVDGQQVNIPVQLGFRQSKAGGKLRKTQIAFSLKMNTLWTESGASSGVTRLDN
jgi:hypothetical protein